MPRGDGSSKTSEPGITRAGNRYRVRVNHTDPMTGEYAVKDRTFATFKEARDWKRRTIHELRAGVYQEPCTDPLSDILAHWLDTARLADNSRRAYRQVIKLAINPTLGTVQLSKLTGRMIQDLYNQPRGTSVALQLQAALNGALELAVREGLIYRNPASGLRVPRHDAPLWTPDELATFLSAVDAHHLCDLYHVAAHTGLRLSELINLQWGDITLDMARLFVRRSKSQAGERRVALDSATVERLRAMQAAQEQRREALGPAWQEHGRVFDRGDGRPVSARTVQKVMERTVRRLGLPHATPHSLRHLWASVAAANGVPLTIIQRALGHRSFTTTADFYIHHAAIDERDAAEVVGRVMERADGRRAVG